MTDHTDAEVEALADEPCRCLHQMPHVRGEVRGPLACKHALGDEDATLLRAVRAYCADTKEKRDWPEIADRQAHKITQSVLRSDWLAAREAAARADERERVAAAIEAEAERAHAAFASDEDDHLADMRNRLGITLEPGHWNRHDDGCGMCGMSSAARIARSGVES